MKGRGAAGGRGGEPGDLYVVVQVNPHERFGRSGRNLTVRVPVTFAEAALGAEVKVPTIDGGSVRIRVPAGTPSGRTLRVPGKGIGGGSLLVTIDVEVPTDLTPEQRAAVERLASAFADDPRAHLDAQREPREGGEPS